MLLARHAECLFWMGRYIERTASLCGVLTTQIAFNRSRADGAGWSWILTLYDETATYEERFGPPTPEGVVAYYLSDREHLGSIASSIAAARANARTLRAMVSTDFWILINQGHLRAQRAAAVEGATEQRLAQVCERIRTDCYALLGSAEATFYRDAGWRFFRLGVEIERADQMSRLLDVRFAQLQTGDADDGDRLGDFAFWTVLLRSCGGHHAFRRTVSGALEPEPVARFLIFEGGFARSLSHSVQSIGRLAAELETECHTPTPPWVGDRIGSLRKVIDDARADQNLLLGLHGFNDQLQRRLADLTASLAETYFGGALVDEETTEAEQIQTQTQSQSPQAGDAVSGD